MKRRYFCIKIPTSLSPPCWSERAEPWLDPVDLFTPPQVRVASTLYGVWLDDTVAGRPANSQDASESERADAAQKGEKRSVRLFMMIMRCLNKDWSFYKKRELHFVVITPALNTKRTASIGLRSTLGGAFKSLHAESIDFNSTQALNRVAGNTHSV